MDPFMKKTFPLHAPGIADERVVEAIKYDVRKYVKRERRKTLPEGFSLWEFNCRIGPEAAAAVVTDLAEVPRAIDATAQSGAKTVYVEILAMAGHKPLRPPASPVSHSAPASLDSAPVYPETPQSS